MDKKEIDYDMYQDFISEYKLDEFGGIILLRILLDRILEREDKHNEKLNDKIIKNYCDHFNK